MRCRRSHAWPRRRAAPGVVGSYRWRSGCQSSSAMWQPAHAAGSQACHGCHAVHALACTAAASCSYCPQRTQRRPDLGAAASGVCSPSISCSRVPPAMARCTRLSSLVLGFFLYPPMACGTKYFDTNSGYNGPRTPARVSAGQARKACCLQQLPCAMQQEPATRTGGSWMKTVHTKEHLLE